MADKALLFMLLAPLGSALPWNINRAVSLSTSTVPTHSLNTTHPHTSLSTFHSGSLPVSIHSTNTHTQTQTHPHTTSHHTGHTSTIIVPPLSSHTGTHTGTETRTGVSTSHASTHVQSHTESHTETRQETKTKPATHSDPTTHTTHTTHTSPSHTPSHTPSHKSTPSHSTSTTKTHPTSNSHTNTKTKPTSTKSHTEKTQKTTHTDATHTTTKPDTHTTSHTSALVTHPSVAVTISTVKSVTDNGHTATTGKDNKVTPIPIVGGSSCWFCPKGHKTNGFALIGMSEPGVYPPEPAPPGFASSLPAITIGSNGDPTYSSEEPTKTEPTKTNPTKTSKTSKTETKTTQTSSCSQITTSICNTSKSYGVNTAGKTTATHTTSSCKRTVACTITATGTQTATASTATCFKYILPVSSGQDSDDNGKKKRKESLEVTELDTSRSANSLVRRGGPKQVPELGKCQLPSSKSQKIFKPAYPGPADIEKQQGGDFLGYFIPKLDTCGGAATYEIVKDGSKISSTKADYWDAYNSNTRQNYLELGAKIDDSNNKSPYINVDHVYELKLLDRFLGDAIGEKNMCDDFKKFFLTADKEHPTVMGGNGKSRLQRIYALLPSPKNLDFVAEDNRLNSLKAPMFESTDLPGMQSLKSETGNERQDLALSIMNNMAVVVSMLRNSKVAELFKSTNTRIFNAFLGIDDLMNSQCQNDLPKPEGGSWASAYSSWMENHLKTQGQAVSSRISSMSAQVTATKDGNEENIYGKALDAFNKAYPTASWSWDNSQLLDWSAKNAIAFAKRDGKACTATSTGKSTSTTSTKATASHTTATATSTSKSHTTQHSKTTSKPTTSTEKTTKPTSTKESTTKHSTTMETTTKHTTAKESTSTKLTTTSKETTTHTTKATTTTKPKPTKTTTTTEAQPTVTHHSCELWTDCPDSMCTASNESKMCFNNVCGCATDIS